MVTCTRCKEVKPSTAFDFRNKEKTRLKSNCKSCIKAYRTLYRSRNKDLVAAQRRAQYEKHRATELANSAEYDRRNTDRQKRYRDIWKALNRTRVRAYGAERRALKLRATPSWSETEEIRLFYAECPDGYHVDHIIPLNHPKVCGLHVLANLQYLPARENLSKGNKWDDT